MKFFEEKFVPIAAAIGAQKHLSAIKDGFVAVMPLSIGGALAVLFNNVQGIFAENGLDMPAISDGYSNFLETTHLNDVFNSIHRGTLNMLAITVMVVIAYNMGKANGAQNPIATSVVTLACYLGLTPNPVITFAEDTADAAAVELSQLTANGTAVTASATGINITQTNAEGLFVAMILALVVGEIFPRLSASDKLKISLPDGVPPAVSAAFSSLIPAILTLILVVAVGRYLDIFTGMNLWEIVTKFVGAPLGAAANSMITMIIAFTMIGLLWTFGIHGANVVGSITTPIITPLMQANTASFNAGETAEYTWPGMQAAFSFLGGSGATIGLLIAIFIFSKSKAARTIAKISVAPGLFEINEPITFGIPIVLNPVYMIPFIFGPVILGIATWIIMEAGILGRCVIEAPWVTPPILIGFLATGGQFMGAIWNVIEIVFLTIWWTPFVIVSDKLEGAGEE